MKKANFKCPLSGEEFFISNYILMDGKYFHKVGGGKGKQILSSSGEPLEFIEKKIDWSDGKVPHFGIGKDSNGKEKMKNMLQKRSNEHYNREIKEKKVNRVRKFDKTGKQ